MPQPEPADPVDAILAALAGLRGGRPQPPERSGPGGPQRRGGWGEHPAGPHHRTGGEHAGPHAGSAHFGGPPFGGGPARLRLLSALAAASLSVSEAAEAIGVDQPRASRLVQQSVELGLVRREADPDDARRTRLALTDEGARLVRGFRGRRREQLEQALADFTREERADLARLLGKLAAAWPR